MRKETINKLCCPFDRSDLDLQVFAKDVDERIVEGLLSCAACSRVYPIVHGIPIMSPDDYRQPELEKPVLQRWEREHGKFLIQKEQL